MEKVSPATNNMSNKRVSKISNRFTELIDLPTFDQSNLFFDAPQEMEIQQGNKTIKYYKINQTKLQILKNKEQINRYIF